MGDKKEDHMHYVALSRVRNLAGLQVLKLNEDKISVNPLVKQELERLRSDAQLNLCFKPVYNLPPDTIKLVFHNTRSLHKHIQDLKSCHLIQGAHIIGIAQTRLMKSDSCHEYSLENYNISRNDQTQVLPTRPAHGLLVYYHKDIQILSQKMYSKSTFEYVFQHLQLKGNEIQVITLYISPGCDAKSFKEGIQDLAHNIDESLPFVLSGDTNVDFLNKEYGHKILFVENTLKCKQLMSKVTTNSQSILDHIYSNLENINTGSIDCYWSDHKIIYAAVPLSLCKR